MKLAFPYILLTFLCLIVGAQSLRAQSEQLCLVTEYHGAEAKTPLAGVSIAAANAGSVMSDDSGQATLRFRTLRTGDQIQFRRIELYGYEVMNTEALDAARVAHDQTPLTIVMCRTEELAQLRDGYRTKAASRYQQQLAEAQAQVEQLQHDGKIRQDEYNRRMDELEERYNQQLQTLDTYVEKFARIDLSELDEAERQIIALVQEGRFDEAIARYDDQHLTQRLQQSVSERRQMADDLQLLDEAIDAKQAEAQRIEQSIDNQIDLLKRVGGEANEAKVEELKKAKQ